MCGLAAVVGLSGATVPDELCRRLDAALAHRGPDGSGRATYRRDGTPCPAGAAEIALVHRRLAIIDLDPRSDQPMRSADGRFELIHNGEIYNYLELRRELEALGHVFRTTSDTEVLIAAYAQWGTACLPRFIGMFAFVLLDAQRRELVLGRDPFGIKPLYWTLGAQHLAIASEIGPLLGVPGVARRLDAERCYAFLARGQTDAGASTMFADIRSLPAGTWAKIGLDEIAAPVPQSYWSPTIRPRSQPLQVSVDEIRDRFLKSIELHLRSDVPVGIALSGGIDSSAILLATRAIGGDAATIRTFSFAATGSEVDESRYMTAAATAARSDHHIVRIDPDDIVRDIDRLIEVQGEPFGSLSIYAHYRVMELAAQNGIKVMLDGQGADELFAGYRPYMARQLSGLLAKGRIADAVALSRQIVRFPDTGLKLLAQAAEPMVPTWLHAPSRRVLDRAMAPAWLRQDWFAARGVSLAPQHLAWGADILHRALAQGLTTTVLPALLRYEDRNSMAFSIETRVPFLTPGLADAAYALPAEHLIDEHATSKTVLRAALRGLVPDEILDRRDKIGFATPDSLWAPSLQEWLSDTLTSERARAIPWLDPDRALTALRTRMARGGGFGFDLWRTVNIIRWMEAFDVNVV